jgi:hypothetical protein
VKSFEILLLLLLKGYAEAGALDGEHRAFTEVAVN